MANPERTVVVAMDGSDYSNYAFDCKYFISNHCGDFVHVLDAVACACRTWPGPLVYTFILIHIRVFLATNFNFMNDICYLKL